MKIYTDGGCRNGVGGWAWWVDGSELTDSGSEYPTTNQRMELWAAVQAVRANWESPEITIVSDSAYLVNCFKQKWWVNWEVNGYRNAQGKPVANRDLWDTLIDLVKTHLGISFEWVKGHSGNRGNDYVDRMASAEISLATHILGDRIRADG